ncbi:hypothetical protein NQZ79_g881 [Umbelopsis isabellina]|nr:hypothetical protein NQZ79_g881 [Umbelopsis isabellina]
MSKILYYKVASLYSSMVRLVITEKGIKDIEYKLVDLDHKQNLSPEYIAINPKGQVPTFVVDGQSITESLDISMWLESHYSSPSLLPGETSARSRVIADLAELYEINFFAMLFGIPTQERVAKERDSKEAVIKENIEAAERQMKEHPELRERYEKRLEIYRAKTGRIVEPAYVQENWKKLGKLLDKFEESLNKGKFLSQENDYSLLDAHATAVLARLIKVDKENEIQARPRLSEYWSRIQERDSFKKVYDRPINMW